MASSWSAFGPRLRLTMVAGGLFLAGCQHTAPHANSTFEVVEPDPVGPRPKSPLPRGHGPAEPADVIVPVEIPGDQVAQPVLPPDAIAALGARRSLDVQVSIDASGHVTDVVPALVGFLLPDAVTHEIVNAIRTALEQWQFRPARRIRLARNARGEQVYVGSEPVPSMVQLRFTFLVSNGRR